MLFKNAVVLNEDFKFKKLDIRTSGDIITEIGENLFSENDFVIDAADKIIVPGLVDIHTHGCIGYDSSQVKSLETTDKMSKFYASCGTTTYFPTIESNSKENTISAVENLSYAIKKGVSGANIGGIHMEGPYFSRKYKGAQNESCLRLPDVDEFRRLFEKSDKNIKLISLAPELEGAFDFIKTVSQMCSVAIGHTDADYTEAKNAIDCGASVLTHSFNGMRPSHHRSPNAIGAALESDIFCEFICDGFHISKTVVKLMYNLITDNRMVLISDSLRAAGMNDGVYELAGLPVIVKDGKAYLEDGTIAGSTITLYECVKNLIRWGISPESAFKMASYNPSKAVKTDALFGSISVGKRADILLLNNDYSIKDVYIRGKMFEK